MKKYFLEKYFAYRFDYFSHDFKNQNGQRTKKELITDFVVRSKLN